MAMDSCVNRKINLINKEIMDIKQTYREETNLNVYSEHSLNYANYTNEYVYYLEKKLTKQLSIADVSNRRKTLLAYEEWINEYKTLEEREKQVDKYLNK